MLESCITDTRALKQQAHSQTVTGHFNYIKRESIPKNRKWHFGACGEFEKGVPGRMEWRKILEGDLETSKMLAEGCWPGKHLYKIRSEDLKLLTRAGQT